MKKLLLLSGLLSIALLGCKRNEVVTQPENSGEIKIGSPSLLVKSEVKLHDAFVQGDKIGVYSVATTTVDLGAARQSNVCYNYDAANSTWVVEALEKPLQWQFDGEELSKTEVPVDLISYYPYVKSVTLDADKASLPFTLVVDQTEPATVTANDLLWARSTGQTTDEAYEELVPGWSTITGTGIKKSVDISNKINLNFNHMMTAVNFIVAAKQIPGGDEVFSDVKITKIEVVGPDITVAGKLNLSAGVFTETANATGVKGSVIWSPATATDLLLKENGTIDANLDYKTITCMVLQPKDFTGKAANGNMLKYTLTYKHDPDGSGVAEPIDITKDFYYTLGQSGTNDVKKFERNTFNNVKAIVTISSDEIRISTTIVGWKEVTHNTINPQ